MNIDTLLPRDQLLEELAEARARADALTAITKDLWSLAVAKSADPVALFKAMRTRADDDLPPFGEERERAERWFRDYIEEFIEQSRKRGFGG